MSVPVSSAGGKCDVSCRRGSGFGRTTLKAGVGNLCLPSFGKKSIITFQHIVIHSVMTEHWTSVSPLGSVFRL